MKGNPRGKVSSSVRLHQMQVVRLTREDLNTAAVEPLQTCEFAAISAAFIDRAAERRLLKPSGSAPCGLLPEPSLGEWCGTVAEWLKAAVC